MPLKLPKYKEKLMCKNQKGFTVVEALLVVVLIAIIGGIGWYVYQKNQSPSQASQKTTITNFEECVAAGNPVMESYPEQCSANGQAFVRDVSVGGAESARVKFSVLPQVLKDKVLAVYEKQVPKCVKNDQIFRNGAIVDFDVDYSEAGKAALIGIGCDGVSKEKGLFVQEIKKAPEWLLVEQTQTGFRCNTLVDYNVPISLLKLDRGDAKCFDGNNNQIDYASQWL